MESQRIVLHTNILNRDLNCQAMNPVVEKLAPTYPLVTFVKANVDDCTEMAVSLGVTRLPTFVIYRKGNLVDIYRGVNICIVEEKVKQWLDGMTAHCAAGSDEQVDLNSYIDIGQCACLNQDRKHSLTHLLSGRGYLESSASSKLILRIVFTSLVNIKGLRIHGPPLNGPHTIKVFPDMNKMMDFITADNSNPTETLELAISDLERCLPLQLRSSAFNKVRSITVYISEIQDTMNTAQIDHLSFFGSLAENQM